MATLPPLILEYIFSWVPYRHLLLVCSRVCKRWSRVILKPTYMPFRTLYHRLIWTPYTPFPSPLLYGDNDITTSFNAAFIQVQLSRNHYQITGGQQCMKGILNMTDKRMKNWLKIGSEKESVTMKRLSAHPLYTTIPAVKLKNRNIWSIVTAITMLSRDIDEILYLLGDLLVIWPTPLIIDLFYGYVVIFHFCSRRYYLSNTHHYKVHAALYLIENIIFQHELERVGEEETSILSCEQTLLINHMPREGEIIIVEYVPGVDISNVVLRMMRRHINLRYLIVDSPLISTNDTSFKLQSHLLPKNAIHSFSILKNGGSCSYNVIVLMPGSIDIKPSWVKENNISVIKFRNLLSKKKINIDYYSTYPILLSLKNQDLCWIMYSIMTHQTVFPRRFPISISSYHNKRYLPENYNKDRILVITPNPLDLYIYCFDYLYDSNENDDLTITINEDLEEFLDQVLIIYNFCNNHHVYDGNIEILYHRFQTIHIEAYNYTEPSITYDFVMWLK
ncbi:F-box DNA helicase 1, partial [Astathelohania contejeani]